MSHKPLKQCHMSCKFIQHFSFKNNPTGLHGNFFVFQLQIETAKFIIPSRHKTHRTRNKNETNTKVLYMRNTNPKKRYVYMWNPSPKIKTSQSTHRRTATRTTTAKNQKSKNSNTETAEATNKNSSNRKQDPRLQTIFSFTNSYNKVNSYNT